MLHAISYCPAAGGNHWKNIMMLSGVYVDNEKLDINIYDKITEPPGTVHASSERNIQKSFMEKSKTQSLILASGHFGELAKYKHLVGSESKFMTITINHPVEIKMLQARQQRLGQQNHPYWAEEEQPFLYRSDMYETYFGLQKDCCLEMTLTEAWNPDITPALEKINDHFGISIDVKVAQSLHLKWWRSNFCFTWDDSVRNMYGHPDLCLSLSD